tara:strand:- start:1184 stop:2140 length:957 start_codon:yes stop_codon:yes gene_type:complete
MILKLIYKKNFFLFLIIIFFLFIKNALSLNTSKIILKIDNDIITSIDLESEYKYLTALNKELKSMNKSKVLGIAKESLMKEIIKKNELKKYYKFDEIESEYVEEQLKDLYLRLNINNENEFAQYLNQFDLTVSEVKNKIKIETFWNELIYNKFNENVEIDIEKLKKQIKNEINDEEKFRQSYLLSEILFRVEGEENFDEKYKKILNEISTIGFKNTANIYSISETSKYGGVIGWIDEARLSEVILDKIKKLDINQITKPINVSGNQLIIKVDDKKEIKNDFDPDKLLNEKISYERNRQLNNFSRIFYQKLKYNTLIRE